MSEGTKAGLSKAELKIGTSGYSHRDWGARGIFTEEPPPCHNYPYSEAELRGRIEEIRGLKGRPAKI